MRLLCARLKNFRSFKKEQTFQFPKEPGLYFMRGVNEVEPRLGGNGVGKTTLWEALLWCLFGKTSRGLKAGDVCNWEAGKDVQVSFDFIFDDQPGCVWTMKRTWGPISWTLSHEADFVTDDAVIDLTKDSANPILAWLRLEFEPFLQCILMAQGRSMFLDLKQDAQASLFSNVLGLERWVDYASASSKKASAQDSISRELERTLSKLQGELEAVDRQDLSKSHDDWEVAQMTKLLEVKADHLERMEKRKKLKAKLIEADERAAEARNDLRDRQQTADYSESLTALRREVRELEDKLLQEDRALAAIASHLKALNEQGVCPTCGKGLSRDERFAELGKAERAEAAVSAMLRRLGDLLKTARGDLIKVEQHAEKDVAQRKKGQELVEDRERDVRDARRDLEMLDRELDRLEDRSEELEREANPYAGMAKDARNRAQELRSAIRQGQRSLDASNERYGLLNYWAKGFKEIRLQEIGEALTELEIEVNSAVTSLGLVDWELKFQIDKEGKGGSIQRGFNVLVRSPQHARPTPWEAWSGGEGQRLRLSGNMGLSDLIRSRTGTTLDLEVWDEPTNGLSPEGIQDLLESLAARARNEQRQIWIVDHKAFDFGGFAGTATVIKAPSGARIRTSW